MKIQAILSYLSGPAADAVLASKGITPDDTTGNPLTRFLPQANTDIAQAVVDAESGRTFVRIMTPPEMYLALADMSCDDLRVEWAGGGITPEPLITVVTPDDDGRPTSLLTEVPRFMGV